MNKKPLFINMISTIIGFTISMGINFILSPYIIEAVGIEAYGFIGLANNFINYASLLTIALNSMAGRFITISLHKGDIKQANKYFNSVLITNIFIAGILIMVSILCILNLDIIFNVPANIIRDVKVLFSFLTLNFIISVIGATFGVATFASNKLYLNSLRGIEANIIRAVLLIGLFLVFKPTVSYLGITSVIVTVYGLIFNIHYTKKLLPQIKIDKIYYDFKAVIEIASAGIWNVFNKLSSIISTGLDLMIANLFIDATAMGILSLAKTIPTLILSVFAMIAGVFTPQFAIDYAKGDIEKLKESLIFSIKILGVLASIPMAIVFLYSDVFYKLWVPDQNNQLLYLITIIGAMDIVFALPVEALWNIFIITNKIKVSSIYLFLNSILTMIVVFIGLSFVSAPVERMVIIAGVSMVFSLIRTWTFLPIYGSKCLGIKCNTLYIPLIKNSMSIGVILVIGSIIKSIISIHSWLELIGVSLLIVCIGLIINVIVVLDRDDRRSIINKIKNIGGGVKE